MSERNDRIFELRDGTKLELIPMDLGRFIQFKDKLATLAERVFQDAAASTPVNGKGGVGGPKIETEVSTQVLLMRALKKVDADDVLDLMQIMTGYSDREHLAAQFRPAVLFKAIQVTIADEGIELNGLLGEAQRSTGQNQMMGGDTLSS